MKYSLLLSSLAFLVSTVSADFYIGIVSGQMSDGTVQNPTLDSYTHGFLARDGQDICDAPNFDIDIGSDPDGPWWNVCDRDLSGFCDGKQLAMDPSDTCGQNRKGDQTVDDGFFYADLLDRGDGNKNVGRCVFELGPQKTCVIPIGSLVGEYTVRCYTDQC